MKLSSFIRSVIGKAAMFNFEDPWWAIAVVLVVVLWVMGVVIPVRMVAPAASSAQHFVEMAESPEQDLPPPRKPPGLVLPVLAFLAALGLIAVSVRKRIAEPEGGDRWTWMACAAGLSCFWAIILMLMTMRLR
jgi:hypothetical protein